MGLLLHLMSHFLHFLAHFISHNSQTLRQRISGLPEIIQQQWQRRKRRHSEGSRREKSGDGEAYPDGLGDQNGAEDEEEQGGDGEADHWSNEAQAREKEQGAADGEESDDVRTLEADGRLWSPPRTMGGMRREKGTGLERVRGT